MCHARTCTGAHTSEKHVEICRSTKFLMLHIRDCHGLDIHGRACKFPWCGPCRKMLRHLTRCYEPATCAVCNPWSLPESFAQLRQLNERRTGAGVTSSGPPATAAAAASVSATPAAAADAAVKVKVEGK